MQSAAAAPVVLGKDAMRRIAFVLAALAPLIWWIGRYTDVDLALADAAFDMRLHAFPWRDAWLADRFNHVILKWLMLLAAAFCVGRAAVDAFAPQRSRTPLDRVRMRIVALSAICVPLVISLLKQASSSHCPWDLARYGGEQPYVRIFESLPAGAVAGHCLPAGHASSALWLVSLAVYWLPGSAGAARRAAFVGIALGAAMGIGQQLRGAHFLTHTLWSVWIACLVVVMLTALVQAHARRFAPDGAR
ncbi:phosphatase PAP2 family protein [Pseudoduganella sp. GCM10020061]|uniref:phosphatase PAP2 family protein n=1 Tax=Pseudoduganella sp. GCM10020061 TaxID=3317345 RepID=UPI003645C01D